MSLLLEVEGTIHRTQKAQLAVQIIKKQTDTQQEDCQTPGYRIVALLPIKILYAVGVEPEDDRRPQTHLKKLLDIVAIFTAWLRSRKTFC